jgi:hypothetical protein
VPDVRVTAVVTAHDRRQYLPEAVRSALDSGADEVVVVRNFSGPIDGCEGRYRDVPCELAETGEKEARGVEAATGDVVAFLDDDDVWELAKVPTLRAAFGRSPDLVYFCHRQSAMDAQGRPVTASHREISGKDPARFAATDRSDLRALVESVWPGNNSSTVLRRDWGVSWVATLREAGWSCDLFWFVAALLSGRGIELSSESLVRLRLHDRNMSQTRGASPEEFRRRHGESSARFGRAFDVMARVASAAPGDRTKMVAYLREGAVAFHFFADLEAGTHPRSSAGRAVLHGPGFRQRGVLGSALVALVWPGGARRLLYRASERRWRLG